MPTPTNAVEPAEAPSGPAEPAPTPPRVATVPEPAVPPDPVAVEPVIGQPHDGVSNEQAHNGATTADDSEESAEGGTAGAAPEVSSDVPEAAPQAAAGEPRAHVDADSTGTDATDVAEAGDAAESSTATGAGQPSTAAAPSPPGGSVLRRADGSLLIGDRIVVPGRGTVEAPYRLSWELLVSASATYQPRQGRRLLPAWAGVLDGAFVELEGHVLFPLMAEESDEVLVMRNAWDGCCVGVPPTPYDAAEVKLTEPARLDPWTGSYGTVRGRLRIEPYLSGGWLLGLYVIERAELVWSGD